jgi:histone-lysine N-methyltransferase MLL3
MYIYNLSIILTNIILYLITIINITRPGKVCALCNLGERSQLGQGELLRLTCPPGFTPEKSTNRDETTTDHLVDVVAGDKSPRTTGPGAAVTCRRQKSLAKCR